MKTILHLPYSVVRNVFSFIALVLFPIPVGPVRAILAGSYRNGKSMFYSHPDVICTAHLILAGWIVGLGVIYNTYAVANGWGTISHQLLSWMWLYVLVVTVTIMGLEFDRVAVGYLALVSAIIALVVIVIELQGFKLSRRAYETLSSVPVVIDWGVPIAVSLVLGLLFSGTAAWRRVDDRWVASDYGNTIEHMKFERRDKAIARAAKTFVADYRCLLRKYLFFGYGDIEVRTSDGKRVVDRIRGVLYAGYHARKLTKRHELDGQSRIVEMAAEIEEEEDEAVESYSE